MQRGAPHRARQRRAAPRRAPSRAPGTPPPRSSRASRNAPNAAQRRDARARHRQEQRVEGDTGGAAGVGIRREDHEQSRKHSTSHRRISFAPPPDGPSMLSDFRRKGQMATLTWLGHAAFRLESDRGKRVYIDPFLTGNPKTPEAEQDARARRRDRGHARPRRPRRRHRRAVAALPRRRDHLPGRAEEVARPARARTSATSPASTRAGRRSSTTSSSR